jgi:hypothetical protein
MLKHFRPLYILFIIVTTLLIVTRDTLATWKIDKDVVLGGNILLFVFTFIGLLLQLKAIKNPNPNAIVRAVMAGMGLKLLGVAIAVLVYVSMVGKAKNVYGVYVCLVLYLLYTWLEVRLFLSQNKAKHG